MRCVSRGTRSANAREHPCVCGQEDIELRASINGTVDLDVIIRDKLSLLLAETRSQRSLVIRAFMAAGRRIEREGKVSSSYREQNDGLHIADSRGKY